MGEGTAHGGASEPELERASIADEIRFFLRDRKRWWLGGTLVVLAAVAVLVVLAGREPVPPFLYPH